MAWIAESETEIAKIRVNKDDGVSSIVYDKMKGRPSVQVEIQGLRADCLLDTGARINVMSYRFFRRLRDKTLNKTEDVLRCANNSPLIIKGRTELEVNIGLKNQKVMFVVVEDINTDVLGGIEMQRQFGIELTWVETSSPASRTFEINSIEAKFGSNTTDEERFARAILTLKIQQNGILRDLIWKNRSVFMAHKWDIGCTPLIKHVIQTSGRPINCKPYRQSVHLEPKINEVIENLRKSGVIRECNSPWNTPLVCVWKKGKEEVRLCLDFRELNKVTERQAFPMPNISEMLDYLGGAKYFSSIDLGNAYYQVELDSESQLKTAFSTKTGQFCFQRMPFGIAAAPGTFQELMTKVLRGLEGTMVYLDDILVFATSMEEHYSRLDKVLERVGKAGLRINPEKCHFLKEELKFLGHIINKSGVQTDPSKTEAIRTFERPQCVKGLRSFLGICNYYRRFIKNYSTKAKALEEMCGQTEKKLQWPERCDEAFREMKEALQSPPILAFPDFRKQFILDTDASFDTIGAVLAQQGDDGLERVVAYGSHSMNNHEKGYCITRKELLAVYYFCQHFKHYLYGKRFILRTDHKALTFMSTTKKPITAQFQTWMNFLSSLDMKLEYRKGIEHSNADALSRTVCGTCTQCLTNHEDPKTDKNRTRMINTMMDENSLDWQKNSAEIMEIKKRLETGNTDKFVIIDGTIKTRSGRIWIPLERRTEKINETHKMLSHAGADKTFLYLANNYDMADMKDSVKDCVSRCEACQRVKVLTTKTKEDTMNLSAKEAFEKIYIDICGPLQETFRKKRYILAIIDQYSRYISLTAITRQDEETLKRVILNVWIKKFGAPREIHTDCGRTFESTTLRKMMADRNIKHCLSSPYHHNTNGLVERQFRTIRDYINASLKDKTKRDWEEIIPDIEFTLNATVQKTTGKSPAQIIFGKNIFKERWYGSGETTAITDPVTTVLTRRHFQVGDKVLVEKTIRNKNDDRFEGPYDVIEKIHERKYLLRDDTGRVIKRNVEQLKTFKVTDDS